MTVPRNELLCPGITVGVSDVSDSSQTTHVPGAGDLPSAGEATATSTGTHRVEEPREEPREHAGSRRER